jgi:hypothetical protein
MVTVVVVVETAVATKEKIINQVVINLFLVSQEMTAKF